MARFNCFYLWHVKEALNISEPHEAASTNIDDTDEEMKWFFGCNSKETFAGGDHCQVCWNVRSVCSQQQAEP